MNGMKILPRFAALALMFVVGLTINASAQSYMSSGSSSDQAQQELFFGQTTGTQRQGSAQMSLIGSHERDHDARFSQVAGRVKYGITSNLEARAEFPIDMYDQAGSFTAKTSVNRVQVGAQYTVTGASAPVGVAAAFDVETPLGSQSSVTGNNLSAGPTFKPAIIASTSIGSTAIQANTQAEFGQPVRALNYNIGVGHSFGSVTPSVEFNARSGEHQRSQFYATPGVYYSFSDRASLGAGVALGLNSVSRPVGVMAKFNWNLSR